MTTDRIPVFLLYGTTYEELAAIVVPPDEILFVALINLLRMVHRKRPDFHLGRLSHQLIRVSRNGHRAWEYVSDNLQEETLPMTLRDLRGQYGEFLNIELYERPKEGPLGPCCTWLLERLCVERIQRTNHRLYNLTRWLIVAHHRSECTHKNEKLFHDFHWRRWGWLYTGLKSLTVHDVLCADVLHYCAELLRRVMTDNDF